MAGKRDLEKTPMDADFASIGPLSEVAAIMTVLCVLLVAWRFGLFFHGD